MTVLTKPARRLRRRRRVRAKVHGTAQRPRISVFRSNRGIFAQLIDDDAGRTIAAVNWTEAELRGLKPTEQATKAGGGGGGAGPRRGPRARPQLDQNESKTDQGDPSAPVGLRGRARTKEIVHNQLKRPWLEQVQPNPEQRQK